MSEHLWDPRATPDAEVLRLERLLARYRFEASGAPREAPEPRRPRARRVLLVVGGFAALAAAVLLALFLRSRALGPAEGYLVEGANGSRLLRAGEELVASARAVLTIGGLGRVEVEPESRLRVEDSGRESHRLFLERGRVTARIWAPPRLFRIGTPAGETIDLGCIYELEVLPDGSSRLSVKDGQVAFELDGREVFVPEGASCLSTPGTGPQAPFFDDASPEFRAAVLAVELAADPDPELLLAATSIERREDGLTLWHLFSAPRSAPALRRAAYDELSRIFPKPEGVSEEGLLALDARMLAAWSERMKWAWR